MSIAIVRLKGSDELCGRHCQENIREHTGTTAAAPSNVKPLNGEQAQPSSEMTSRDTTSSGERKSVATSTSVSQKEPVLTITLGVVTLAAAGAGFALDNMLRPE